MPAWPDSRVAGAAGYLAVAVLDGGRPEHNTDEKLTAQKDGRFEVTNPRTGYSKEYLLLNPTPSRSRLGTIGSYRDATVRERTMFRFTARLYPAA